MKRLIELLQHNHFINPEKPLETKDVLVMQKKLVQEGYPFLPKAFLEFLKYYNGVEAMDSAVLGILPDSDSMLDVLNFNKAFNSSDDKTILAYDDSCFLVYDESSEKYLLLDRYSSDVLDQFMEDELVYGLNSVLHLNND